MKEPSLVPTGTYYNYKKATSLSSLFAAVVTENQGEEKVENPAPEFTVMGSGRGYHKRLTARFAPLLSELGTVSWQRSGAEEACWAGRPEVG